MPLGIFVPFYGDPEMLRSTVMSVLAQEDPDWTLTVVDDGYPGTEVTAFFAGLTDPRVTYLRNATNLGANGNFRRCIELATTELIVLLGADDILLPNYVSTVLAAHRDFPQAAIIQPGVRIIDEKARVVQTLMDTVKRRWARPSVRGRRLLAGEELATSLLRGNWLYFPSLVFKREPMVAIGFRPGLNVVQDLALVIDLVAAGHCLLLDSTICFSYRRHSGSDSSWRALEGTRFVEERRYFRQAGEELLMLGWRRAAAAGRHHWLSRANAMLVLPKAIRAGNRDGVRNLIGHVTGNPVERDAP